MLNHYRASRGSASLQEFMNDGIIERNKSFQQIVSSGEKDTQEQQYLILLNKQQHYYGLTDAEASFLLGMPKSERAGARRKGLMDKHEAHYKNKYGEEWREHFRPLIVKNGNKSNIHTGKKNSVWMINKNRISSEE